MEGSLPFYGICHFAFTNTCPSKCVSSLFLSLHRLLVLWPLQASSGSGRSNQFIDCPPHSKKCQMTNISRAKWQGIPTFSRQRLWQWYLRTLLSSQTRNKDIGKAYRGHPQNKSCHFRITDFLVTNTKPKGHGSGFPVSSPSETQIPGMH